MPIYPMRNTLYQMNTMPNHLPSKKLFYSVCVRRYLLTDDEIRFFELKDHIVAKFNEKKYDTIEKLLPYDYNIISLGSDCRAKAYTTTYFMENLALPQKPFDRMVTPPIAIYNMLSNDFENYHATDIFPDKALGNYFINTDLGISFIHDHPALQKPIAQSIDQFNHVVLPQRIKNFYQQVNRKTLFFMFIPHRFLDQFYIVDKLSLLIKNKFNANLLVFCDTIHEQDDGQTLLVPQQSWGGVQLYKYANAFARPYKDYIWHLPDYYVTSDGLQYEECVADCLVDFIKKTCPLHDHAPVLEAKINSLTKKIYKFYIFGGKYFLDASKIAKAKECLELAIKANNGVKSLEIIEFEKLLNLKVNP